MKLLFMEKLGIGLRGGSAKKISEILQIAQENGVQVTPHAIESHQLAGGNPAEVINALIFAKKNSIDLNWMQAAAIDLSKRSIGKTLEEVLNECTKEKTYTFNTFSPDDSESLVGFTRDGNKIKATCTISYYLTPHHAFGQTIEGQQERIAVKVAILINKASDPYNLQLLKSQHEQQIVFFTSSSGIQNISLKYEQI